MLRAPQRADNHPSCRGGPAQPDPAQPEEGTRRTRLPPGAVATSSVGRGAEPSGQGWARLRRRLNPAYRAAPGGSRWAALPAPRDAGSCSPAGRPPCAGRERAAPAPRSGRARGGAAGRKEGREGRREGAGYSTTAPGGPAV